MLIRTKTISEFQKFVFPSMETSDELQAAIDRYRDGKNSIETILMHECWKWSRKAKFTLNVSDVSDINANEDDDCECCNDETAANIGCILLEYRGSSDMQKGQYDDLLNKAGLMGLKDAIRGWYVLRVCLMINCDGNLSKREDKLLDQIELYMLDNPAIVEDWPSFMVWRREVELLLYHNIKSKRRSRNGHIS